MYLNKNNPSHSRSEVSQSHLIQESYNSTATLDKLLEL